MQGTVVTRPLNLDVRWRSKTIKASKSQHAGSWSCVALGEHAKVGKAFWLKTWYKSCAESQVHPT